MSYNLKKIALKNLSHFLSISAHNLIWYSMVFQYSHHHSGFCGVCHVESTHLESESDPTHETVTFSYITQSKLQHILRNFCGPLMEGGLFCLHYFSQWCFKEFNLTCYKTSITLNVSMFTLSQLLCHYRSSCHFVLYMYFIINTGSLIQIRHVAFMEKMKQLGID